MDDVYWGGERHGGQRGRGPEGKLPFVAAVATNEEGHPIQMRMSQLTGFSLGEVCNWASKHLSLTCSVVSDGLKCFPGVKKQDVHMRLSLKATHRHTLSIWKPIFQRQDRTRTGSLKIRVEIWLDLTLM